MTQQHVASTHKFVKKWLAMLSLAALEVGCGGWCLEGIWVSRSTCCVFPAFAHTPAPSSARALLRSDVGWWLFVLALRLAAQPTRLGGVAPVQWLLLQACAMCATHGWLCCVHPSPAGLNTICDVIDF